LIFLLIAKREQTFALGLNVQNIVRWYKYMPDYVCTTRQFASSMTIDALS